MPAKKKKVAKKDKEEKEEEVKDKPPEEEKPKPMYEIPEYLDPAIYTPVVTLNIKLILPQWSCLSKLAFVKQLDFEWKTMISTRLFQVENQIRKRHGGSIGEVFMCLNVYRKDLILHDKTLTLRDCGIVGAGE